MDTTPEARELIRGADKVLHVVGDPLAAAWIEGLNPTAESLATMYIGGATREEIYAAMVDKIMVCVRRTRQLCVAFYGHPGVFCYVAHEAMRLARLENVIVRMVPAISAVDWLFADLGVDPGAQGCQSYEATTFLLCGCRFDPYAALLLWQIGAIGDPGWPCSANSQCLELLTEYLKPHYGPHHEVVIYEAAWDPVSDPSITRLPLAELPQAHTTLGSTLFVPPRGPLRIDPQVIKKLDQKVLALLTSRSLK